MPRNKGSRSGSEPERVRHKPKKFSAALHGGFPAERFLYHITGRANEMKILFIFIDGFGIGENDPAKNPIYAAKTPAFDRLFCDGLVIPTDALLGVDGLPQSATGQTTIFTGVNAPKAVGRHVNAQPTRELRDIICRDNMFTMLQRKGFRVANANAYRQEYLDVMNDPKQKRYKPSVTSVMTMSVGLPFRKVEDYKLGRSIYHDITGRIVAESGYDTRIITPAEAAERYYAIAAENDFTLFEFFLTDLVGHKMNMELAVEIIERLDSFIGALIEIIDPGKDLLFITSDHGNIEDISVKTHTKNLVPTILYGNIPDRAAITVKSLVDIVPLVVKLLK